LPSLDTAAGGMFRVISEINVINIPPTPTADLPPCYSSVVTVQINMNADVTLFDLDLPSYLQANLQAEKNSQNTAFNA